MKHTKYNKPIIGTLFMALALLTVFVLSGFSSSHESASAPYEIDCQEVKDLGLSTGTLRLIEERKDAVGNTIQKMSDDNYSYFFDPTKKEVLVIVANDAVMEGIVKEASTLSMELTPGVDNDIMSNIIKFFPEYNLDAVKIDLDTESGSPVEFFQYTIREYKNDIQINKAQMSFSYDGQLTFVYGSHNQLDETKDYSIIGASDAVEIAFSHLRKLKDAYEENINSSLVDDSTDEYITATEDMVLPDGVKVGDTFKLEKLPSYEIFIDSQSDINVIRNEKLMYGNTVAWLIEFTVQTSWGKYDTIFNPLIHIYVDAATGNVLEVNMTDGI